MVRKQLVIFIGDVVKSRLITNRIAFETKLKEALIVVRDRSPATAPHTQTHGDEIQAVYSDPRQIFHDIWTLAAAVAPYQIRFSIAVGYISTRLNKETPLEMDGPAFHAARDGIEFLKSKQRRFSLRGETTSCLQVTATATLEALTDGWNTNRWQILDLLCQELDPRQIAERLRISERAVYKNIERGFLRDIMALGDAISSDIGHFVHRTK